MAAVVRADQSRPSRAEAEAAVHTLLAYIGEDTGREGLLDTPRRVVEAFDELAPDQPREKADASATRTLRLGAGASPAPSNQSAA